MKKVATMTFHASHNYGSVLQAYALQKVIEKLGHENEIINFRTERQKDLYTVFTKRKGIKYILKNLTHALFYKALKKKYQKFECFINNRLKITEKEYATLEQLENADFDYDCYVCGSDQIWNPVPADFDWSYYLPFVKKGKKISYAPSFGPLASMGDDFVHKKIGEYLKTFDAISVREKRAKDNVKMLSDKDAQIVLDPTLLLSCSDWGKLISDEKIVEGEYIFLYTLFASPEIIKIAKEFSKKLQLPVVVSNFSNQYDCITPFKKYFECGPEDFLNLIKNAKLVLVSSFHGTVFSIKFNKPFFAIGGNEDARIATLLDISGLKDRSVNVDCIDEKIKEAFDISFEESEMRLKDEVERSVEYLRKALED